MKNLKRTLRLMLTPTIAVGALRVSLIVGTALNLINHGQAWWAHQPVSGWRILLNFVVPFCVSNYSAARHEARRQAQGD